MARSGDAVSLSCIYDLQGPLYTIKWYFNDNEFYRFVPKALPTQHSYPVNGMKVDVSFRFLLLLLLLFNSQSKKKIFFSFKLKFFVNSLASSIFNFDQTIFSFNKHLRLFSDGVLSLVVFMLHNKRIYLVRVLRYLRYCCSKDTSFFIVDKSAVIQITCSDKYLNYILRFQYRV